MRVLVVAPHPDDEAIGCGGTMLQHAERGDRVSVAFLTSGELGLPQIPPARAWRIREDEASAAAEVLGVAEHHFLRKPDWTLGEHAGEAASAFAGVLRRLQPEVVYVPHDGEWHPDHRVAHRIVIDAVGRVPAPPDVLTYEVWTPLGAFEEVHDITGQIDDKLRAVRCYASQLGEFDYVRAVKGLAAYRGALAARTQYAEVFGRWTA